MARQGRLAGKAMAVRDAMKIVYSPRDGQDVSRAETDVFVKLTNLCVWIAKVPSATGHRVHCEAGCVSTRCSVP